MKFTSDEKLSSKPMPTFKPAMRAANKEGRKTQTRRALYGIKKRAIRGVDGIWYDSDGISPGVPIKLRYKVGDVCYLLEPLSNSNLDTAQYADDGSDVVALDRTFVPWVWKSDKLTQIFMPRYAARYFTRIKSVRVQRLWEISEEDAIAEGITSADYYTPHVTGLLKGREAETPKDGYRRLWETINGGGSWSENPWVAVYEYEPFAK